MINLQKVFGTLDHQILLKKMKYLGFSKNTFKLFKSYLNKQKFKKISIITLVTPLLLTYYVAFGKDLFYANDLSQVFVSNSLLYADNTYIVFKHKSLIEVQKQQIKGFFNLLWLVCG